MSPYRYLDHPHPHPSEQVHVRVQLDGDEFTGECLWAHPLGADLYRVLSVPFTTAEVGMDDIVLALTLGDEPEFVEVVARRSHVRFSFELADGVAAHVLTRVITSLCVVVECCGGRLYVANLPDRTDATEFQEFLETHAQWFERVDLTGAAGEATAQEDVSTGGES